MYDQVFSNKLFRSIYIYIYKLELQQVFTHFLILATSSLFANGVTLSNLSLSDQNTTDDYTLINFDITWENSWRASSGPSNWDACWVFAKYRKSSETTWNHATLNYTDGTGSGDGHTEPTNSNIASSNDNGSGGAYGVFIHRSADMAQGTVNYTGVQLQWNYGDDGLADYDEVEVRLFAIEMVYVPQATFTVGSGGTESGSFTNGSWTSGATIPLNITSEGAITIAQSAGNLWGTSSSGDNTIGGAGTLPAAFPKGFAAFYCMKYELSQQQYAEFLNTLDYDQQNTRTATKPSSASGTHALASQYRQSIEIKTSGTNNTVPAVYAMDYDDDGTYDEANDGHNLACNYISWADGAAYFDWAGLRPMTELEFEKACRGNQTPVANEYVWGTTNINNSAPTLSNSGQANEGIATGYSTTAGNGNFSGTFSAIGGPARCGVYAANASNSGRETAGATYYGAMEMSGNVQEQYITVGHATGRAYTGAHGDGELDASGNANVTNWPGTNAIGTGQRGASFYWIGQTKLSDRTWAAQVLSVRGWVTGARGGRTAP